MTGLGKTIAQLVRFRRQVAEPVPAHPPSRLRRTVGFGSNPGALAMYSHVPDDRAGPLPLVVVLHGCMQTAAVYDYCSGWSALGERCGFAVLYPEQGKANNPKRCFNWFEPGDTARNSGEVRSIVQMIERLVVVAGIDRRRIFITGLSAGGAMAAAMLATYPEIFAGGAILSGLPYRTAGTVREAFHSMFKGRRRSPRQWGDLVRWASAHQGPWPTISIWHGMADTTVVPGNADELAKQWLDVHRLNPSSASSEISGRLVRQVWRGPDGKPVIEKCLIVGMGHGAAIDARGGAPGQGNAGPFMLDVGISSTYQCALSWGLTGPIERTVLPWKREPVDLVPQQPSQLDAGTVISRALRAAGLMRQPMPGKR